MVYLNIVVIVFIHAISAASDLGASSSETISCSKASHISVPKALLSDEAQLQSHERSNAALAAELNGIEGLWGNRIRAINHGCGDVCNTNLVPKHQTQPGKFFPEIQKRVNCCGLWSNEAIDASRPAGDPPPIPDELRKYFNYSGRVAIEPLKIYNENYLGKNASMPVWEKDFVNIKIKKCRLGRLRGNYGINITKFLFSALSNLSTITEGVHTRGKHRNAGIGGRVLVIGSETPWVESCVLAAGASSVVTLEYGTIESRHPNISSMTPNEARALYLRGELEPFDAVVTFSSVEHSGLGRYGDAMNPWGDLQTIARAWCLTKPGGHLVLGVPDDMARDSIQFNAHRMYGPVMYMHLTANWEQVSRSENLAQNVYIFKRID
jgi:hypothetical protein